MVKIPNSPEAQAFAKYGDYSVSMHTGTPNISVPIFNLKGREMDIDLSITYDASGIKVEQLASWVGLGWNLNAGGRISRQTNGLPDDYLQGDYITTNHDDLSARNELIGKMSSYIDNTSKTFSSEAAVREYFDFLDDINKNFIDAQPDVFKITAPGINTTVVFDINDNNIPKSLDNPRIKIDGVYRGLNGNKEIIGWKVVNEDGTIYYFGKTLSAISNEDAYETTLRAGNDENVSGAITNEFVSSWLLTRIVSPNKKDIYDFSYYDSGYWSESRQASAAQHASINLRPNETIYFANEVTTVIADGTAYSISQQFLKEIYHNNTLLVNVNRGARVDLDPNGSDRRLDEISVYNHSGELLKQFEFLNTDYFNNGAVNNLDKKLKLDGILVKDNNLLTIEEYSFEYDRPNELPPITSLGIDFVGYFNGASGNSHLFEKQQIGEITFNGANRDPNINYAKIGMLNKITYPTGGSTVFEFEAKYNSEVVENEVTISDLFTSLYSSDDDNNSFYLNEDGSIPDDTFSDDGFHPKIKTQRFIIDEYADHRLSFYGTAPDDAVEAYIVNVDNGRPGNHFSDYLSSYDFFIQNKVNDQEIMLAPGIYMAVILMDELPGTGNSAGGIQYGNISLSIKHKEEITNTQSIEQGGIRVARIKNYGSNGQFLKGKNYQYVSQNRNFRPILYEFRNIGDNTSFIRKVFQTKSESQVTYSKVRELQINKDLESEGYVEYNFYGGQAGVKPNNSYPHENNYFPSVSGGNIKNSTTVNNAADTVQTSDYEFFETYDRPIKIKGITVFNDDKYLGDYIYIKQNPDNTYGYDHITPIPCNDGGLLVLPRGIAGSGGAFCSPIPCINDFTNCPQYVGVILDENGGLTMKSTFVNAAYGGVSAQIDTVFLKDRIGDLKSVVSKSETKYEMESGYYFPTENKVVDSKGDVYRTTNTFPDEFNSADDDFFMRNRLSEVISSKTEKLDDNGNVVEFISATKKDYYISADAIVPSKIYTSTTGEQNSDFEERIEVFYYSNGNVRESKPIDGPTASYIWGYNSMYPVAKIENASYNDVLATGFSQSILNNFSSSDASRRTELEKIRTGLPNAMVTTYTYKPLVGVTSMTDPRGYTVYYEYDSFNRLKAVKDKDNNLVKDYEYHYKGQN